MLPSMVVALISALASKRLRETFKWPLLTALCNAVQPFESRNIDISTCTKQQSYN